MCSKKLSAGLLLALALSVPCFSQSFEDGKTYQVTGKQLNKLESDFKIAKTQLDEAKSELLKLQKALTESKSALTELETQFKTALELLKKSENKTLENEILIGGACLTSGAFVATILTLLVAK